MKTVAVVMLCMSVAIEAYIPMGPRMADQSLNVHGPGGRIVGGEPATAEQGKYQISLNAQNWMGGWSHICGGSLLDKRHVLTAAHCCDGSAANKLQVKFNGLDREKLAESRGVTKVTMHPSWNTKTIDYDYCVLELNEDVIESTYVKFVALATETPAGMAKCQLTGWGLTKGGTSTLPKLLQFAEFDVVDRVQCNEKWKDVNTITPRMMCAAHKEKSGCNGDSGGPLMSGGKQVGVVSWGSNGCPPDTTARPTVYGDVAAENAWITAQMK